MRVSIPLLHVRVPRFWNLFEFFFDDIASAILYLLELSYISCIFTGGNYNMTSNNVTPSISSGFNRRRNAIVGGLAFLTAVHVAVLLGFKNSVRWCNYLWNRREFSGFIPLTNWLVLSMTSLSHAFIFSIESHPSRSSILHQPAAGGRRVFSFRSLCISSFVWHHASLHGLHWLYGMACNKEGP